MMIKRARLMVWLVVIGILLVYLLRAWPPIQKELERTALELANREIVERANDYKQQWLLQGQPQRLLWQGQEVTFSDFGWVLPNPVDGKRCPQVLNWLYPEQTILNQPLGIEEQKIPEGYRCQLNYSEEQSVIIILQNNRFTSVVSDVRTDDNL
ncbi:type II secretion system protein [Vibrio cincinnatiensis]|uniref:type II secretion system protein n=1 Tax=Vibrio cincinnatiensis TaxID=675 RepID=UPI001EDFB6E6|nr:MSHA biogenesis protein MshF [Vibrio cincinnatiensis]MCG3730096.1 MSHA biogenesis protein MshF [Vibrio cincinnatiensis]